MRRIILLLLMSVSLFGQNEVITARRRASAAPSGVTYDTYAGIATTGSGVAGGTITLGGTNRGVAIWMAFGNGSVPGDLAITVGGVSATLVTGTTVGGYPVMAWYCVATGALTGSQTISATWGTATDGGGVAIAGAGVNQTTPCYNGTTTSGASPLSRSITSSSGELTLSGAGAYDGATVTVASPGVQTSVWTNYVAGHYNLAGGYGTTSGTETHKWASSGSNMAVSGVTFKKP